MRAATRRTSGPYLRKPRAMCLYLSGKHDHAVQMDARESVVEMSDEQRNEVTCDGASVGRWFLDIEPRLRPGQASEDRRIMATCRKQHKTMPDRVLKAQALPDMKERAERVEDAPDREKP